MPPSSRSRWRSDDDRRANERRSSCSARATETPAAEARRRPRRGDRSGPRRPPQRSLPKIRPAESLEDEPGGPLPRAAAEPGDRRNRRREPEAGARAADPRPRRRRRAAAEAAGPEPTGRRRRREGRSGRPDAAPGADLEPIALERSASSALRTGPRRGRGRGAGAAARPRRPRTTLPRALPQVELRKARRIQGRPKRRAIRASSLSQKAAACRQREAASRPTPARPCRRSSARRWSPPVTRAWSTSASAFTGRIAGQAAPSATGSPAR